MGYSPAQVQSLLKSYAIRLRGGKVFGVRATSASDALDSARSAAIAQWDKDVESVIVSDPSVYTLCAVEQNEVVCAHPGCTGPYNCKERGLDLV